MLARHRRSIPAIAIAFALAASTAAAAPAAAAEERTHPSARKRLIAMAERNRPATAVRHRSETRTADGSWRARAPIDYLTNERDLRDPRTYAAVARAMTEDAWGVTLPDLRGNTDVASGHDSILYGLPAGDLTGDGLDDAVAIEYRWGDLGFEFIALRANAGTDGAPLWSVPLTGAYDAWPLPTGDLTGDGRGDILLTRFDLDGFDGGTCALLACAFAADLTYTWTHTLISGTGATMWSTEYDGRWSDAAGFAFGVTSSTAAGATTATNYAVIPDLTGDHDGDGNADLVVNSYDVTFAGAVAVASVLVAWAYAFEDVTLFTTRAEIVSGDDGTARLVRAQERVPGGANLIVASDAVGDATSDLAWASRSNVHSPLACVIGSTVTCAQLASSTLDLEMLDGRTLATAWTTSSRSQDSPSANATAAGADLTGDGKTDLLTSDGSALVSSPRIGVVSGADGTVAWHADVTGEVAVVGSVGGAPGDDLLTVQVVYDDDLTVAEITTARLDGATGAMLGTNLRTIDLDPDGFTDVWAYLAGDADGDGVLDLGLDAFTWIFDGGETSRSIIESGATGDTLRDQTSPTFVGTYPAGDMDADGDGDLLELGVLYTNDGADVVLSGISIGDGVLWSRVDAFLPCFQLTITFTGDQSGAGGDDQVYSRAQCLGETIESRVDGLEQTDGSLIWGYGDALTARSALGAISGRVTDEAGNPIVACIDVLLPDGGGYWYIGYAETDADGAYRVGGLGAGRYVVAFWGCGPGGFADEYYDNHQLIADADLVDVVLGADTTGIDASLAAATGGGEPPVNDNFADAIEIASPGHEAAETWGATSEDGEPQTSCAPIGRTAWYRFTPEEDSLVVLTTAPSDYDTVLGVYTGSTLGDLREVGCSDDTGRSLSSTVSLDVTAGTTYFIQAGGFFGDGGSLELVLV